MGKILCFLLFLTFISLSCVQASISLSPSKFYFELGNNGKECKTITISSEDYEGKITIRNVWANSIDEGSNINDYVANPQDLGITVHHIGELENFKKSAEVEVCISSLKKVESKGAIIFTPESETNVVVEVGAWIFINFKDQSTLQTTSSSSSSGSGSGIKNLSQENSNATTVSLSVNNQELENQKTEEESQAGITGSAIGENKEQKNWKAIALAVIVVAIAILIFTYTKRKRV